jgi:hypothetical protein
VARTKRNIQVFVAWSPCKRRAGSQLSISVKLLGSGLVGYERRHALTFVNPVCIVPLSLAASGEAITPGIAAAAAYLAIDFIFDVTINGADECDTY